MSILSKKNENEHDRLFNVDGLQQHCEIIGRTALVDKVEEAI